MLAATQASQPLNGDTRVIEGYALHVEVSTVEDCSRLRASAGSSLRSAAARAGLPLTAVVVVVRKDGAVGGMSSG